MAGNGGLLGRLSIAALLLLATKVVGFARELIVAHVAGLGPVYDAFLVGYTPHWVCILLLAEPLRLSVMLELRAAGEQGLESAAGRLISSGMKYAVLLALLVPLCGLGWTRIASGADGGASLFELRELTFVMAPLVSLALMSTVAGGVLLYQGRVVWVTTVELAQSVAILVLSAGLVRTQGAMGLAWAHVLGFLLGALLLLAPTLRWRSFKPDNTVWRLVKSAGFRDVLLANGLFWTGTFVERYAGLSLGEGNVSALGYAFRVAFLPIGVVVGAVSMAAVPYVLREKDSAAGTAGQVIRMTALVLGCVASFFLVNVNGISALLMERSAHPAGSTAALSRSLAGYSLGILTYGVAVVTSRLLQGLGRTRPCVTAGAVGLAVMIVLNLILPRYVGVGGVALAFSSASGVMAFALLAVLDRGSLKALIGIRPVAGMLLCWGTPVLAHAAIAWLSWASLLALVVEAGLVAGVCGIVIYNRRSILTFAEASG